MAEQRYTLVSDDTGDHYVVEVEHADEWHELTDDQINDCPDWAWPVNGALTLVTFTDPRIDGDALTDL